MSGEIRDYNELLEKVTAPDPIPDAYIDSPEVVEARDAFFASVKQAFQPQLSYLALESATHIDWVSSKVQQGAPATDVSTELVLHNSRQTPVQQLAMVFQTNEHSERVVRFMVLPLNKFGNAVLRALAEADESFSDITNRG